MNERKLNDVQLMQELWNEATVELLRDDDLHTGEQAYHYGLAFAEAVVRGELTVDQLRDMRVEANALEAEAIGASSGDIEKLTDADYFEALARRIANGSTKVALEIVKTETRRTIQRRRAHYMSQALLFGMPGTDAYETKDSDEVL